MFLSLKKSRYQIILVFAGINLALFTLLRVIFYLKSWNQIDNPFLDLPQVLASGFIYDFVFNIYLSAFFAMVLLFVPNRIYGVNVYKYLTYLIFFLCIYGLYLLLVAEWLFWQEFSARFNFISVDYLIYRREVSNNIFESYPVLWILGWVFIISTFFFLKFKPQIAGILNARESVGQRLKMTGCILALTIISYIGVGQSLRESFENNYEKEIASNGAYQFVSAFRNNTMDYKNFYAQGDDQKLSNLAKQIVRKPADESSLYDIARQIQTRTDEEKHNVILISVESLSAEFLTRFGKAEDITPFMDEWFKQGLLFTNFYATGTRTARGLEAITLAVPPTPGRSIVKRPGQDNLLSIGEVFKSHGYDVAFLYGGRGYFDNMNTFFGNHGYRIVDQTDISKSEITFENAWGVADEVLYDQVIKNADIASQNNTPFFYHVMTTSNHRPFTFPEGRVDLESGSGRNASVKYTDYALKHLIDEAKKHEWFDNTIFVVVADHCASSAGKVELPVEKYHIPMFIYAPKFIPTGEVDKLASQIDIAPTILDLLDFKYESRFWGYNILAPDFEQRALIGNYQKLGLYENNKLVVLSPGKKVVEIDKSHSQDAILPVDLNDPLVQKTMAYYQGAEYIYNKSHIE